MTTVREQVGYQSCAFAECYRRTQKMWRLRMGGRLFVCPHHYGLLMGRNHA